jgi:octopine/nopaline transport system permease protein
MDFAFLWSSFLTLLPGIPLLLKLAGLSVTLGLLFALLLVGLQSLRIPPLAFLAQAYIFVFRGTPLLVQIFLIYFGLGQFRPALQEIGIWWFFRDPSNCALLALTLNTAAYGAEIVRGGIQAVPSGQIEAAKACGMTRFTLLRRIVAPIALRQALPAYGNEIIIMVKATSLASTITLMEVTGLAHKLISQTFRAVEVFACAALIYLTINFLVTRAIGLLERRLSPDRPARTSITTAPVLAHG